VAAGGGRLAGALQANQVATLGSVEQQRLGQGVHDVRGRPGHAALLQTDEVIAADVHQLGQLLSP
jgi:hypothetical protein